MITTVACAGNEYLCVDNDSGKADFDSDDAPVAVPSFASDDDPAAVPSRVFCNTPLSRLCLFIPANMAEEEVAAVVAHNDSGICKAGFLLMTMYLALRLQMPGVMVGKWSQQLHPT